MAREHKHLEGGRLHSLVKCSDYPCSQVSNSDRVGEIGISGGHVKCKCGKESPHVTSREEGRAWMNMHFNDPIKEISIKSVRGARYGTAGKSLSSAEAKNVFGSSNTTAGEIGERALAAKLSTSADTRSYDHWRSLSIPAKHGQKRYGGDVDFVVSNGNRVILIDAKQWSANHVYWSLGGQLFKDFGLMKDNKTGKVSKLSKNMDLAVNRYREALPGCVVSGIVVFVPTKAGFPTNVTFLRWPGGIGSYFPSSAIRKISRFLGPKKDTDNKVFQMLQSLVRG